MSKDLFLHFILRQSVLRGVERDFNCLCSVFMGYSFASEDPLSSFYTSSLSLATVSMVGTRVLVGGTNGVPSSPVVLLL